MRRLLPLALVLGLLAATGCGERPKAEYVAELSEVDRTLQRTLSDILAQVGTHTSTAQSADRLGRGARALQDAAERFDAIEPPSDARGGHDKLVAGLRTLAARFRRAAAAARSNDTKTLSVTLQGLAASAGYRQVTAALRELATRGVIITTTAG